VADRHPIQNNQVVKNIHIADDKDITPAPTIEIDGALTLSGSVRYKTMKFEWRKGRPIETCKSVVVRPPQEWGSTSTKQEERRVRESSTELITVCAISTYATGSLDVSGNGRCFDASRR
jgi:hypothetical protein